MAGSDSWVDITLRDFLEPDPAAWGAELEERLEEYVACLPEPELLQPQVLSLLGAVAHRYGVQEEVQLLLRARAAQAPQLLPPPAVPNNALAQLRKVVLDSLKAHRASTYELKRALWLQNYQRIKDIFECRVVKILSPPLFLYVTLTQSTSVPQIQDRTCDQLHHMYGDLYYVATTESGCQKHPFLKRWLADDAKRTYQTCIFDPRGSLPYNYNTYVGMRAAALPPVQDTAAAQAGLQSLLHHIQEVFCNGVQAHADYVLKWFASIVRYPYRKTEVLLLLFGVEGCGKSMIIDFFANRVLGTHLSFQTASPGVDVFGKFAVGTHRKLLCFCDEGGEELTKYQDALKNLITAKAIRIEKKGHDIRIEDNYTNVIVASNNQGPVRISSNDRRVVAFQCSDVYKDNLPYFEALAGALASDDCARAFYDFLMGYPDLDDQFPFQARRPITAYYESLLVSSLPLFWRFWSYKCLTQGPDVRVRTEQARALHKEFLCWKSERDYEAVCTEARFGRDLNELVGMDNSGVLKIKRSTVQYEIHYDTLHQFLVRKRKFDENAF
jgi:hypothetical protein